MPERKRVIIIGAGFAGLAAARALRKADADVTVIDRQNHHTFQPLLYQVASAALSPADIASPVRRILRTQRNADVIMGEAVQIGHDSVDIRTPEGTARTLACDYLLLAAGKVHDYFGNDEWARHAPGLKTIDDALEIRRRVLAAFERAETTDDPDERRAAMTFVIVGAGPTGVEMAGAFAEIATHVIRGDFRRINTADARVILAEGAGRVLPGFPEENAAEALRQIRSLGVEVRLNTLATEIADSAVTLSRDDESERVPTHTVVWAAGVRAAPVADAIDCEKTKDGRLRVNPDLSLPGMPTVFAAGDIADLEQDGEPIPGVAPAAMQMGEHAGRTIAGLLRGESDRPDFRYTDKGMLATIGRYRAVGRILGRSVTGPIAWLLWAAVHIFFLVGFRNRLLVAIQWTWNYITFGRGARLITDPSRSVRQQNTLTPPGQSGAP